jgi:hypothetical protein
MNGDRVNIWKKAVVISVTLEHSLRQRNNIKNLSVAF